jgi:hypothetical protein
MPIPLAIAAAAAIPWSDVTKLIIQLGLPAALWLIAKWRKGGEATEADLKELEEMAANTPGKIVRELITELGLSLDDPKVVSVLQKAGA